MSARAGRKKVAMATVETEWVGACSLAADRWRPKRTAAYPTTSAAPSQYDLDRPLTPFDAKERVGGCRSGRSWDRWKERRVGLSPQSRSALPRLTEPRASPRSR